MLIYHIVLPESWAEQSDENFYEHESLETEGFIHCSYKYQLEAVLERYYSGQERVVILEINTNLLTSELRSEPSTNGENYPHIYGRINRRAIVHTEEKFLR